MSKDLSGECDAVVIVSFGGPDGPADVMPFLENVTAGKNIPRNRLLEVAEHYQHFGGRSPINEQNTLLQAAVRERLATMGLPLPVYVGNRNWHPLLTDTVAQMKRDGVRRALAWVASAYGSYSGCRQYLEDIDRARRATGADAPEIDKIRLFFNHPLFLHANAEEVRAATHAWSGVDRASIPLLFTAHSIPADMAAHCDYEAQLMDVAGSVAAATGHSGWTLVYQSRSGPPHVPWLEPDVCDVIRARAAQGCRRLVLAPIGFVSDHLEVLYDLDVEARDTCSALGVHMVRARAAFHHPAFVEMVCDLILERVQQRPERPAAGRFGPAPDVCSRGCCRGVL